ncbi:MAG: hypothetical protein OEY69_07860 [Candidatus Krumholzibacteria bacterium]|nr:hypothetical protein [Candidatus Krumholzibacteria bacterium]
MTKWIVVGTKADGTQSCEGVGADNDAAMPAFDAASSSGRFAEVELFRFPALFKRWRSPRPPADEEPKARKKAAAG